REERAQGSIDQARGEHLDVPEAPLALEEAPWDFACGVGLLDVLAGEWEKVDAGSLLRGHGGHEHGALTIGDEHRPVRKLGKPAGFERQRTPADHDGFTDEHRGCAPWRIAASCGATPT